MANPTRRGFLTMAAGLAAQPKGALSSSRAEGLPAGIQKLLPDESHPGWSWYTEGGLDDGLDSMLANTLKSKFDKIFDRSISKGLNADGEPAEKNLYDRFYDLMYDKDVGAYKDLKKWGMTDENIKSLLSDMDSESRMYAQGLGSSHFTGDELKQWQQLGKATDVSPSLPSLTNIGGYLARAGYKPGQGTAVHPDMTIPFDMNNIVHQNMRPLPAPSRSNPGIELNLDDLPERVSR